MVEYVNSRRPLAIVRPQEPEEDDAPAMRRVGMGSQPRAASEKASREASEWFVLLQDDPADLAQKRRFDEWLMASADHAVAWSETVRASSLAESLLPFDSRDWSGTAAPAQAVEATSGLGERWHRWAVPLAAAATACVLALVAPVVALRLQSDHVTTVAQVREITLQDGSVVTLAPSSAISVSFSDAERQVRLLSGEAFFAVKPETGRPFNVVARDVRASVLGTSFDVQLESDIVRVSVVEGKVRVDAGKVAEVLEAGQGVRVGAPGTSTQRLSLQPPLIAAWRQGQLVAEDVSFGSAVEQLDRYFDGVIVLADASLSDRSLTGVFDLRDPVGALRAMAKALHLKVREVTPWVLIVSTS
jgi:transmembrane sensor